MTADAKKPIEQEDISTKPRSYTLQINASEKVERAYARLVKKLTKENLWLYVLSLLREGPRYGYEIREEIQKRFGFKPGQVTSYRVLYTLKRDGYIALKSEEPSEEGPIRKYYVITQKGENLLSKAKVFLRDLSKAVFG
ncbi:MAG: PadR family transcriptional regulator [Candidatus Bathyarchaeia archaeon]